MMMKKRLVWAVVLMCAGAIGLTGCCICPKNKKDGLATIKCQPMDQEVFPGETAKFKVVATGPNLNYQWYFSNGQTNGLASNFGGTNDQTAEVIVPNVTTNHVGHYWAVIESLGFKGPRRARTRDAALVLKAASETTKEPGTNINIYPGVFADSPAPTGNVSDLCGTHCSWVFYANSPTGFDPEAGSVAGYVKVKVGASFRGNGTFNVMATDTSNGAKICSTPFGTQEERFPVNASRFYTITIYFNSNCPPSGTDIYMTLEFRSS